MVLLWTAKNPSKAATPACTSVNWKNLSGAIGNDILNVRLSQLGVLSSFASFHCYCDGPPNLEFDIFHY